MSVIFLLTCSLITLFLIVNKVLKNKDYQWLKKVFSKTFFKRVFNFMFAILNTVFSVMKKDKDEIRKLYIDINNYFIEITNEKFELKDSMIVLPHCLQNSNCNIKITNDISNCKDCGKCCVSEIKKLSEIYGVKVYVVTGGTAARNIVINFKPKFIIAVACERDLSSAIKDIGQITCVGVLNNRPNGPCYNTSVDVSTIKNILDKHVNI